MLGLGSALVSSLILLYYRSHFSWMFIRYKVRQEGSCSTSGTVVMSMDYECGGSGSSSQLFFAFLSFVYKFFFLMHMTGGTLSPAKK